MSSGFEAYPSSSGESSRSARPLVTRRALCIGIDNYPSPGDRLGCCVSDARSWQPTEDENGTEMTFEELCTRVRNFETEAIEELNISDNDSNEQPKREFGLFVEHRICHNCGIRNHISKSCDRAKSRCNSCQKYGHLEKYCRNKNQQGSRSFKHRNYFKRNQTPYSKSKFHRGSKRDFKNRNDDSQKFQRPQQKFESHYAYEKNADYPEFAYALIDIPSIKESASDDENKFQMTEIPPDNQTNNSLVGQEVYSYFLNNIKQESEPRNSLPPSIKMNHQESLNYEALLQLLQEFRDPDSSHFKMSDFDTSGRPEEYDRAYTPNREGLGNCPEDPRRRKAAEPIRSPLLVPITPPPKRFKMENVEMDSPAFSVSPPVSPAFSISPPASPAFSVSCDDMPALLLESDDSDASGFG